MRGPGKIPDKAGPDTGGDRAARLADALRDNLRRRKTQERARKAGTETGGAARATDGVATGDRKASADGCAGEGMENGGDAQNVPPGGD